MDKSLTVEATKLIARRQVAKTRKTALDCWAWEVGGAVTDA